MLGIYEDEVLIKSVQSDERASEAVPILLQALLKKFEFSRLIYANGPGSYMGIKISFLSLKTLSIVKDIPLLAVSAFELNDFKPIRANKKLCFVYKKGEIILENTEAGEFFLPQSLQGLHLKKDNLPFYFLEAIWE
ncbi:glycoprotease [Campylobacter sp. MIT 97-5078]|uniref:glycoprotease n=1 Tax=Campylobacter sp. MIT 97-5078 TaxID=1548153 RepID=UPI00051481FF|nr:glycoprotease [Campylobacter sp. MIT 97-5078]KGI56593.1 glycoprotease [Campylobacter sp. MIT 97-5078]TQR26815.1 glycoprotease [Campylobacter sp. MIT 97-5078]